MSLALTLTHIARLPLRWVPMPQRAVGSAHGILDFRNLSLATLRVSSVFHLNCCSKLFQQWVCSSAETSGSIVSVVPPINHSFALHSGEAENLGSWRRRFSPHCC